MLFSTLFVDDDSQRWETFKSSQEDPWWAKTAAEAVHMLQRMTFDEIHLDNTLDGPVTLKALPANTGAEVVRQIGVRKLALTGTKFVIHAHDVNASIAMLDALRELYFFAKYQPFGLPPVDTAELRKLCESGKIVRFAPSGDLQVTEATHGKRFVHSH